MLKESATGIRAPGYVGDKIVAKERKKRTGEGTERKTGAMKGTKAGKNCRKWQLVLLMPTCT